MWCVLLIAFFVIGEKKLKSLCSYFGNKIQINFICRGSPGLLQAAKILYFIWTCTRNTACLTLRAVLCTVLGQALRKMLTDVNNQECISLN